MRFLFRDPDSSQDMLLSGGSVFSMITHLYKCVFLNLRAKNMKYYLNVIVGCTEQSDPGVICCVNLACICVATVVTLEERRSTDNEFF